MVSYEPIDNAIRSSIANVCRMPLAENWRRRGKFEECKFVFPNAPQIPITVNFGMRMPGWYDIVRDRQAVRTNMSYTFLAFYELFDGIPQMLTELYQTTFNDLQQAHDEPGILRSRDYLLSLIKAEKDNGIEAARIVIGELVELRVRTTSMLTAIGGFSQGGAISLFTGLTCQDKLAGFFGLSSYLLMHGKIKDLVPANNPNKNTPVFMGHGDQDPLVRYEWGRTTAQILGELGLKVDFRTYRYNPGLSGLRSISS